MYKCDVCKETFKSSPTLASHKTSNHDPSSRIVCNFCNSQAEDLKDLQKHISVQHITKQKMENLNVNNEMLGQLFICGECNRSFTDHNHLIEHIQETMCLVNHPIENVSTQNTKIRCDNCEFEFPKEQIQSHIKEKHAVRWVRDSILCLTEGIARLQDLVVDNFEKLNTDISERGKQECAQGMEVDLNQAGNPASNIKKSEENKREQKRE